MLRRLRVGGGPRMPDMLDLPRVAMTSMPETALASCSSGCGGVSLPCWCPLGAMPSCPAPQLLGPGPRCCVGAGGAITCSGSLVAVGKLKEEWIGTPRWTLRAQMPCHQYRLDGGGPARSLVASWLNGIPLALVSPLTVRRCCWRYAPA